MINARICRGDLPQLTCRQEQCLRGVLELKSAKQIARDLGVSQHAVEKHLRLVREKFGVCSTAEAARLFALSDGGGELPHYGTSDLPDIEKEVHSELSLDRFEEAIREQDGALFLEKRLTPLQTLLTIAAVSFVSIVGLLLLVACAEGIRRVVSG